MTRLGLCAAALLVAAAAPHAARGQNPVFSSRVEAVRVDVLVTENGRQVRGLGPDDFEILDNGVPQRADLVSFEQLPLNVVLTFDTSTSVRGNRLVHLRDAGRAMLEGLKEGDQAALVSFSHVVAVRSGMTAATKNLRNAIEWAEPAGTTSLVDACFTAMLLGESDVGRSLVIVFSDGVDTTSWLEARAVIDAAKRSDVVVYAAAAATLSKAAFLPELTEQTGGRFYPIGSTENLGAVFREVLDEFRQRYLVSYSPAGVAGAGWHQLSVRIRGRKADVRARPGYLADR